MTSLRHACRLLTILAALAIAASAHRLAAQSMQTILTNGPVSNRFNIVLLSEGYTTAKLAQFTTNASDAVRAFMARQPYQEYSNYFNAFAISVASAGSGSDHPSYPVFRDTYFNSSFDLSDRAPSIPPNSLDPNYAEGQGKVDALLLTYMPDCHLPILLINDSIPGGSDGPGDKTAIVSMGGVWADTLIHETGHVMGGLGDEYTNALIYPDVEEPNTTRETRPAYIKWGTWIDTNTTPIPTPPTAPYTTVIGLFEGAHYHPTGWYRPKFDCAMNHPGLPFCEVCSEALVLALYQKVRPVDLFTPTSTTLSVSSTQALTFSLTLLQPSSHQLTVQWSTNGTPLPGATNAVLTLSPLGLGNGVHQVRAVASDPTPLVRNDPTGLLLQTVTWTANVSILQLSLDSFASLPGGDFAFRVNGYAPAGFTVQSSTNLTAWLSLNTNYLTAGQFWYTNYGAGTVPRKFFRAVTPPQ
jgi:hypothetical protein